MKSHLMKPPIQTTALVFGPVTLALLAVCGCSSDGEPGTVGEKTSGSEEAGELPPREYPYEMIEGEPMFTVVEEDWIPAIDEPVFVSASDAAAFMEADETVLGVVGRDGTAKCYSAWQLDLHEIVNDTLDGTAIAATW